MTFATMLTRVKNRIAGHGNLTWGNDEINQYLNDGYWEFCRITYILRRRDSVTITYDTAVFSLPETPTGTPAPADVISSIIKLWRASWRLEASPYTEQYVGVMSTRKMDRCIGVDWRNTTGENVRYVVTDAGTATGDIDKITIYPKIDTAAHAALSKLWVDYSYLPVVMSATTDVPLFGERYHQACVEYAVWQCTRNAVQSKKEIDIRAEARYEFYRLVAAGKSEVNSGMFGDPDNTVIVNNA